MEEAQSAPDPSAEPSDLAAGEASVGRSVGGRALPSELRGLSVSDRGALLLLASAGGSLYAGLLPRAALPSLHAAGLVRYEVPVGPADKISVPPLQGFQMNRVGNDYLEKLARRDHD